MKIAVRVLKISGAVALALVLWIILFAVFASYITDNSVATLCVMIGMIAFPAMAGVYMNKRISFNEDHPDILARKKAEKEKRKIDQEHEKAKRFANREMARLDKEQAKKEREVERLKKKKSKEDAHRQKVPQVQVIKDEQPGAQEASPAPSAGYQVMIAPALNGVVPGQSGKKFRLFHDHKAKLKLVGGIGSLPAGYKCDIIYNESSMRILGGGQEFFLDASKMIDVSVMTQSEIQKQYVSSIGGAIAGAMLLGPFGAIIGGMATQKKVQSKKKYLVITYISRGETKYIVFDLDGSLAATHIKDTFRYLKKSKKVTHTL